MARKLDPIQFRVGDIVEAQITLTGIPIKRGRTNMVINLRSLALLTGSFTEVGLIYINNDDVKDDTVNSQEICFQNKTGTMSQHNQLFSNYLSNLLALSLTTMD